MMVPNIEVKINGKVPYRFEFDTGARGNAIRAKLVRELGLDIVSQVEVRSPASKESMSADVVKVSEIAV